jgi:cbb3-type cytochrome oxidase subunit 3
MRAGTPHEHGDLPLGAPDTYALRRRVLLTAVVGIALWLASAYTVYWLGVADAWVLVALALIYLGVIRPLMRPVREAISLRRRLAYEAYLQERRDRGDT